VLLFLLPGPLQLDISHAEPERKAIAVAKFNGFEAGFGLTMSLLNWCRVLGKAMVND
jgi:hypothetical protein